MARAAPDIRRRLPLDELTQRVAMAYLTLADEMTAEPRSDDQVRALAFGIARRLVALEARSARHERAALDRLERERHAYDHDLASQIARSCDVRSALDVLSELERDLVRQRYILGLSVGEIAKRKRCSLSWVSKKLQRARTHVRRFLEESWKI